MLVAPPSPPTRDASTLTFWLTGAVASSRGLTGVSRERLRRRGPGEDSTAQDAVARRFPHPPGEYPNRTPPAAPRRRLTDLSTNAYHPPDDDAPCVPWGT